MNSYDFTGRVSLVTGGTSGIGLATALAFARAGASVVLGARDEARGRAACAAIERAGGTCAFVHTDVREETSVAALVEQTLARFGRLDCAVNCAGVGGDMKSLPCAAQPVWDEVMRVNARGVWLSMRHEVPALLASGGGAIVNIGSIYGVAGRAAHHAYVASKHAVVGLTRSVALEYAQHNVRVNVLCAGVTSTAAMQQAERMVPEVVRALVAEHPVGRMATEQEIAGAALWLCSDASRYVTGAPLHIDGGFLAA
jgi:NAD(P)-dependent dehydrogenase (short-subunit alcohol dehydrogenase family)